MNQFYSSLIVNCKKFPGVHQVFKPRYNKEFLKRLTANLDNSDAQRVDIDYKSLEDLKHDSSKLIKLKNLLDKRRAKDEEAIEEQIQAIEDKIMPTIVAIPNRCSKQVPREDIIIETIESNFLKQQNLSKILSHRKLSYINNCYSKSVVGPNSHYYFGIGAKAQYALSRYFTSELTSESFVPVSGLCLTKSAVVEAANSRSHKDYFSDPGRILTDEQRFTTLHLTEASRESLLGFVSTIGQIASNNPLRLLTTGASYRSGSDWFDGDDKRITQFETVHALVLNSSIESYSMREHKLVRDIVWNMYKKLELPARLVHCSPDSMYAHEFEAYRIDLWVPSRQEWIQSGRVSHHRDYISIRAGMKRGHIIDSTVYDGQVLMAAIIENRQTSRGKFVLPDILLDHITHLTNEERANYVVHPDKEASIGSMAGGVLRNHEQRRYLVKKSYLFGHSKRAEHEFNLRSGRLPQKIIYLALIVFGAWIDWTEVWMMVVPNRMKGVLYDYVYRPVRRNYWKITYPEGTEKPPDTPWGELDLSYYDKTKSERRKEKFIKYRKDL